jgi:tetratricopeptide (TPR) repeat protein
MSKVHAATGATLALGLAVGLTLALVPSVARAEAPKPMPRHYKAQPLNLHKEQLGPEAFAVAARGRMQAGDCEGALTDFDAALRTEAQDPTLYRDRGLCHEKLGHPHPAIDDYREYLTDAPDAADAEGIRDRLARLEDDASGRTPSADANDDTNVPSMNASVSMSEATPPPAHDHADTDEDDEMRSSLRRGHGFGLAPFFSEHKWFFKNSSFGDSNTWSESVGGQLRYSVGKVGAFILEAGYEHFNSTAIDQGIVSGLTSMLGFEFRFPLDARYDNQLVLAPGLGYEHLSFEPSNPADQSTAGNALVPRLRFGYRRMLGVSTSFDVSMDGGVAEWFIPHNVGAPDLSSTVLVAVNLAIVWGL